VITRVVEWAGRLLLGPIEELGRGTRVLWGGLSNIFIRPFRLRLIIQQMEFIGIQSLPIIVLAGFFTGAVFALQSYRAFQMFGAESMVGGTVGVALTRELGPTLTGLLVAGRAGSAIAAEIGSMRVSEQIDALDAMATDPMNYLVSIIGAWAVCVKLLGQSEPAFMVRLLDWVDFEDFAGGIFKGLVFGTIIGTVACYKGYYTEGGASGVGQATTSSVVVASVMILTANYFIAWALG
jgi:phospholipid/cholesterol/gamma-HCH transport system permease protein